jgi:signal transduction histidine kinase
MSWRLRSVRKRILLLALVPVLSLVGIYTFYTTVSARAAINLARAGTLKVQTTVPEGNILVALNAERPAAMVYLAAPAPATQAAFQAEVQKTARAVAAARAALTSAQTTSSASPAEQHAINVVLAAVKTLPALRAQISSRAISRPAALAAYDGVVQDVYQAIIQSIRQETSATVVDQALALIEAARSEEALSEEVAVMAGDFAARSFPPADRHLVAELAGTRRTMYGYALADLDPQFRMYWTANVTPQDLATLTALENKLIDDTAIHRLPPPISPVAWEQAVGAVAAGLTKASDEGAVAVDSYARTVAWGTARGLLILGGLGLLAVIISIAVAIFTGRGLVRELRQLRESALDLANNRLPEVVDRLALGQEVDVSAAAPQLPASTDEVREVRDAFDTVQRTAVQAAVGQARLRQGMSDVFRNLARRSQSLLHRQLTLLDAMERRARDPQELEDLFRIDHLTTRMRRHAESLIILSGHTPARGWRNPVPLIDVLRAAVAEVEDYPRIRVTAGTQAALVGPAVGDVIHLIAELAENATMFSPPNTPVTIHGDTVGQGFAVEIEDRGLGLSDEQLTTINGLLDNPPPFDPSNSDQLGLFVAGQLAKRHNIKISMRPSPYGGTTAIVLLPRNLVVTETDQARDPALAAVAGLMPRIKGRHASRSLAGTASATTVSDTEPATGPLTLTPSAAPSPWPGIDVPAMREPADVTGLTTAGLPGTGPGPDGPDATGPGATGLGAAGSGAAGAPLAGPGTDGSGAGGPGEDDPDGADLPRRVRQANLAPQLRDSTTDPAPAAQPEGFFSAPAPEEARATMAAIQHGWERGRSVFDLSADDAAPGPATQGPAPQGPAVDEPAAAPAGTGNGEAPGGFAPAESGWAPDDPGTPEVTEAAPSPISTQDTAITSGFGSPGDTLGTSTVPPRDAAAVPAGDAAAAAARSAATSGAATSGGEAPSDDGGSSA